VGIVSLMQGYLLVRWRKRWLVVRAAVGCAVIWAWRSSIVHDGHVLGCVLLPLPRSRSYSLSIAMGWRAPGSRLKQAKDSTDALRKVFFVRKTKWTNKSNRIATSLFASATCMRYSGSPFWLGPARRFFGLMEGLEKLFRRPVDLVVESAIKNPYFLKSVQQNQTSLYALEVKK
jgi:hypothetical protein